MFCHWGDVAHHDKGWFAEHQGINYLTKIALVCCKHASIFHVGCV